MILELFWTFFKIGLFTFGGGYAMIPMIKSEVVSKGWILENQIIDFIGISESTPGPFAINIATLIGSEMGGFLGALVSTIGVILPSFIIILIIATIFKTFSKNKYVKGALKGIKPVVVGLIGITAITLCISTIGINIKNIGSSNFSLTSLVLIVILFTFYIGYKKIFKKNMSPILLILISALFGILVF